MRPLTFVHQFSSVAASRFRTVLLLALLVPSSGLWAVQNTVSLFVIEAGGGSPTLVAGGTFTCPTLTLHASSGFIDSYYPVGAGTGQWQASANGGSSHVFTASAGPGYASTNIGLTDPANPATGASSILFPSPARYYPLKGIKVSGSFPLVTSESGTTATFTVRLNSQPSGNVVLNLATSNTAEGQFVNPTTGATVPSLTVTFTTANWNTNQTVTVKGIDDALLDGTRPYTITISDNASLTADAGFTSLAPYAIQATNADNETAFSAKINFQPATAPTYAGYLIDSGAVYAHQGGLTYGWNAITSETRDRNSSLSPDQRYDTLIHMQKTGNPNASWEIAVPNGSYQVHVVAGDASNLDSIYQLNVEGVLVINGTPTAANHWIENTATVVVTDGKLTVSNAIDATNNKLCFIDIMQIPTSNG